MVIVGGIHGNEPAGVLATAAVLDRLRQREAIVRGKIVGLCGNLGALRQGVRFLHDDLNRRWTPPLVAALDGEPDPLSPESREQTDLYQAIEAAFAGADGPRVLLDLHTSSGFGSPFIVVDGASPARHIADALLIPQVRGMEGAIGGTLTGWASGRGCQTLAFEGGQHTDPRTPRVLEALCWGALLELHVVAPVDVPDGGRQRHVLESLALGHPPAVGVVYRHAITPRDEFKMLPGFMNFHPVRQGQPLARDAQGEVRCPAEGWLLLPLYQGLGSEGFLIGTERTA